MAQWTPCQTPGTQFHMHITENGFSVLVALPKPLRLNAAEAKLLEANIHNALELVLARYFTGEET